MTPQEKIELLAITAEECGELTQETMKIVNPTGKSSIEDIQTIRFDQKSRIKEILVDLESISVSKL